MRRRDLDALPLAHLGNALVPRLDDLALADDEGEGCPAVARRVEFGAISQGPRLWSKERRVRIRPKVRLRER